jgi:hypothetical protein
VRVLPALDLGNAAYMLHEKRPRAVVNLYAEGYSSGPIEVPFRFVTEAEWAQIMKMRAPAPVSGG